jgi:hypothetical protein
MERVPVKKVTLTEYGARLLGEHALTLPAGSRVRAYITLLLRRYARAREAAQLEPVGEKAA